MTRVQVGFHVDGDVWEPQQIKGVEDAGFDLLTTGEHMVFFRPILDVITVLSYAAAVTDRIKLVPSTLILPLRHPDHHRQGIDLARYPVEGTTDCVCRHRWGLSARISGLRRVHEGTWQARQ